MSVIAQAGAKGRQLHKFGGSSLADVKCYLRVAGIMAEYSQPDDMMVVSAAGSTTNQLINWLKLSQTDRLSAHSDHIYDSVNKDKYVYRSMDGILCIFCYILNKIQAAAESRDPEDTHLKEIIPASRPQQIEQNKKARDRRAKQPEKQKPERFLPTVSPHPADPYHTDPGCKRHESAECLLAHHSHAAEDADRKLYVPPFIMYSSLLSISDPHHLSHVYVQTAEQTEKDQTAVFKKYIVLKQQQERDRKYPSQDALRPKAGACQIQDLADPCKQQRAEHAGDQELLSKQKKSQTVDCRK